MEDLKNSTHCLWTDLSFTDVESLVECQTVLEFRSKMAPILSAAEYEPSNKRLLIELDLFHYLIRFAKSKDFSFQQISTLFSIVRIVHRKAISTPCDNFKETIEEFYSLLLHHSANRPPYSIGVFSADQVKLITDYVLGTYFKHFKFYKYVYTKRVQLNITVQYPGMPEPLKPETEVAQEEVTVSEDDNNKDKVSDGSIEVIDEAVSKDEATISDKEQELSKIIKSQLDEQLAQLKTSVNEQLTIHDQKVSEKLQSMESTSGKSKTKKH